MFISFTYLSSTDRLEKVGHGTVIILKFSVSRETNQK